MNNAIIHYNESTELNDLSVDKPYIVAIDSSLISTHSIEVPKMSFSKAKKAIPFLLEDTLLDDMVHTNQAVNYLYSIETWVKTILKKDEDIAVDHLEEDWATIIPPIEVPNGKIYGKIVDMQARFNINHLIAINKDSTQAYLNPDYKYCLDELNTSLEQDFMGDFILEHINQRRPIERFKHLSQLKQVEGIQWKDYLKIKPYLIASDTIKTVNINTASPEVIACLHSDLSVSSAQDIMGQRPFNSLGEAQSAIHHALGGQTLKQVQDVFNENLISVNSQYFLLTSNAQIASSHIKAKTLFHRNGKLVNVVSRTYEQVLE